MPIWTDSRGVNVVISDDAAREHANHLLTQLHPKLAAAEEYDTQLDDADLFAYHEAERLLTEVGDVEAGDPRDRQPPDISRGDDDDALLRQATADAKRREQRRQTAQLVARTYLQIEGAANAQRVEQSESESESFNLKDPERGEQVRAQKDVVRVRRDREHDEWLVTGRGPDYHVRDEGTAEREAKRRAGWTT